MELYEKILKIYPELTVEVFRPMIGSIMLRNDSDGRGAYIYQWNHPTLPQPTEEQLNAVKE